jgi:hypothetical protein
MVEESLAESGSDSFPGSRSLRLAVHPDWIRANRRRIRMAAASLLAGITTFVLAGILILRRSPGGLGVAIQTSLLAVALSLGWFAMGPHLTRARRFRGVTHPFVVATPEGVTGDVYPNNWYRPRRRSTDHGLRPPTPALEIRSPILQRTVEVAETKNFVPWNKTTLIVGPSEGDIVLKFWSLDIRDENWIFHDIACLVPPGKLPTLLLMAGQGGSDMHADVRILSDEGRNAAVICNRHDIPGLERRPGVQYVRLRAPKSAVEGARWLTPECRALGSAL